MTMLATAQEKSVGAKTDTIPGVRAFLDQHCVDCHQGDAPDGGISFQQISWDALSEEPRSPQASSLTSSNTTATLEAVNQLEAALRKLRGHQMPPTDYEELDPTDRGHAIQLMESLLDGHANRLPLPGYVETIRRLTRQEYQNAIRDLLAVEIDATKLLPPDEISHGFDNITVDSLSPTLMHRYVLAAQRISRQALGRTGKVPQGRIVRIQPDITQEARMAGLPPGTRGGSVILHQFPQSGIYEFRVRLARDRNEKVEGLSRKHEMEILIDRDLAKSFVVKPNDDHTKIDEHLHTRLHVSAGPHDVAVTFVDESSSLMETMRQPLESHFNFHRHPRQTPAFYELSIVGPIEKSKVEETPSRKRVLAAYPNRSADETTCAKQIFSKLARRAFRRPVTEDDLERPMSFYRQSRSDGGDFEDGIEAGLSAILVSPKFLLRVEQSPEKGPGEDATALVSDLELASRLSFFLWSSIPDEELLSLAEQDKLRDSDTLRTQVSRMLKDPRASNLVTNFASQWLYLRNLDSFTPDARLFPDFDDNLRQAFRQETELLFAEIVNEDLSVLTLIRSDHTYLNERLAKHYEIPHIYGSRFRKVMLDGESGSTASTALQRRGGILRHGSFLTVTSYATRTSPVIRGHWILKNLLACPPPPPPANVPTLEENTVDASLPLRDRLAAHRDNAACAGCHNLMDPAGFALENYDAIGRWREMEQGSKIDDYGSLPGVADFQGVSGLEDAILERPELFVGALAEKLMTFAIGRGVEPFDGASVREVVRKAKQQQFRFSSVIMAIVESPPFQMRSTQHVDTLAKNTP